MWRLLVPFLMVSPSIAADTITVSLGHTAGPSSGPFPSPRDAVFAVRDATTLVQLAEWRIEGITPDDVGRVWTVEVDSLGPAGDILEAAIVNPENIHWSSTFVDPLWLVWPERYDFFGLDRIEFHLHEYFTSPIGAIADWDHVLIGPGRFVPEPASIILLLIAAAHASLARRWRHKS